MRRSFSRLLGITAAFAVSGCNSDRMLCNTNLIPAISLTVRDSLTGQLVGSNSHLIARLESGETVSSFVSQDSTLYEVGEEPGKYDLTLTNPEYLTWTKTVNVSAKQDDPCHPETVTLTALLQHH
jgi:hypothetical protein